MGNVQKAEISMKFKRSIASIMGMAFITLAWHAPAQVKKKGTVKKKAPAAAAKVIPPPPPPFATAPELEEGKILISRSDCLTCHKIDDKLVGPPYSAIAGKYPQNQTSVDELSQKVIKGGSGVWGPVPMAPHPAIALADANKMVKYILTLNSKNLPASSK
jgi:cytochrome c